MTEFLAKAVEPAKRHAVKVVGGASLATVAAFCYATFTPLADTRDLRRELQSLRERLGQLEWGHERPDRHGALQVAATNAVAPPNLVVAP